jgi:hypothetical protein
MTLLNASGLKIERRAVLPSWDLRLADGRQLKFKGGFDFVPGSRVFATANGMRVIASLDDTPHGRLLHVSISYASRDPSWEDIKQVRSAFFPDDVDTMMLLPKAADYVNLHEHAFHVWQTPVEWGVM